MAAMKNVKDGDLVAELQRRGFEVKKKILYVKQGMEIDAAVFEHFRIFCKERKIKLKEALSEAVAEWMSKRILDQDDGQVFASKKDRKQG